MSAISESSSDNRVIPSTAGETLRALYSHASPVILTALALSFIGMRVYLGNWRYADLIAPAILVAWWPFQEWLIHVHLLHMRPRKIFGRTLDLTVSRSHRKHHVDPTDLSDITINLEVFPIVVPIIVALCFWLFPTPELASGFLAVYFTLALNYEWTHFLGHVNWCPPLEYYRRRVRLHRLHHYRHEQKWWGVSMGMGDVVLGTAPDAKEVERSPTVNNIHGLIPQ